MKSSLKLTLLAAALAASLPSSGSAQAMNYGNPERMVAMVDGAVSLSADQKVRATAILKQAAADMLAIPDADRLQKGGPVREKMRADIRAILTPEQQKKYDRTPQMNGGGLTQMVPDMKVARLSQLVGLTAAQKTVATQIFTRELNTLLDLPEKDRGAKGMDARQSARDEIRLILTPEQQAKYDAAPQIQGGGKMGGG